MDQRVKILLDRTFNFGIENLKFLKGLSSHTIYRIPIRQLARSAISIGANYEEAQGASSKKDFHHKIAICYKEARESVYWLRVLKELHTEKKNSDHFEKFIKEGTELSKIFATIKRSTRE
jgi:four helix bundle protein